MATPAKADAELINFIEALAPSAKLTTREACAFLRVSQATMERWRTSGCGPEYIQSGGKGARAQTRPSATASRPSSTGSPPTRSRAPCRRPSVKGRCRA